MRVCVCVCLVEVVEVMMSANDSGGVKYLEWLVAVIGELFMMMC